MTLSRNWGTLIRLSLTQVAASTLMQTSSYTIFVYHPAGTSSPYSTNLGSDGWELMLPFIKLVVWTST